MMDDTQRAAFLKDEYLLLQNQYEDSDRRSLTIKGWISAAAVAGVALGLDKSKNPDGEIWIIVAVIAACIWYLEGRWKTFQYANRGRIELIERYFRDSGEMATVPPAPFQMYASWFETYVSESRLRRRFGAMRQDFVFLPYLPIIAICVFFYFKG
jgi:hypothetical protein